MPPDLKVACLQNCATDDVAANIAICTDMARAAHAQGARMLLLPEHFSAMYPNDAAAAATAVEEDAHPALAAFRALAAELGVWILMGSIAVRLASGKVNNRSCLLAPDGQVVARYDKIHLFDVRLRGAESYRESATVAAGGRAVLAPTPWGALGMTVCYDVRFAYLYRTLARAGAAFLAIPAAFTHQTGLAHWHVLVRARAIETGCYVFAPGQCGTRPWGRRTFGHSLIVDPWGEVLADGGTEPGFILADVDPARVTQARSMIPALEHDRTVAAPSS
ncbi:MAG: carbon-nitrogen hydrolase family protein [Gammaproteobacteria bacterium]